LKYTWREYLNEIEMFARAMIKIGVRERKSVNIMGSNAPEWAISFIGAVIANCVSSGVYITNGPEACLY
jgi:long-subunit acyl-CoA synthetase (AMP-forming)